ncbi:MAG: polyribonucleotide nucleotidyltransferase [Clostridia bacterium]|nr:polyribonucleotide nucleotidyltransferase [Clostridia bacterium]
MELGKKWQIQLGENLIEIEIGKYAFLTNGSCVVSCGGTKVMVHATMANKARDGIDFFPLGVDYEEKMYAVGKIPGSFKKREGKATDKAILTSRLIDRPLRPLFPKGFYNDVSIVATPISVDTNIPPEPLAMLGSSIALTISDIPFEGPTGSVGVALINGEFIINPTAEQEEQSEMQLYVAGTKDAVLMVEAGAKEVTEEVMLNAIMFAHSHIKKLVEFQEEIAKELNVVKNEKINIVELDEEIKNEIYATCEEKYKLVFAEFDKQKRNELESVTDSEFNALFAEKYPEQMREINACIYNLKKQIVRNKIINDGVRPDGRTVKQIRPIWCEVGMLPMVHGSGVFTRGLTQVMTTLTLGMLSEAQELDSIDNETSKRYMHHYNMPPYSTGEAKPMRAPGRREIGHGALAERALIPVLPSEDEFPYAIRTVSEVLSSNGSTSQASVCGSTLALMDGGVPIKAPVAGIAMGLIKDKESGKVCVLSDIQGLEDFFGDMDFKVAGTEKGITAIQMDMKIKGIDEEILKNALAQAKEGRQHILGEMLKVIDKPRQNLSEYAPKIIKFTINPDKIKDVIGSGGKVINKIIEETGVKIDIDDDGNVSVASNSAEMLERAKEIILSIAEIIEEGKVVKGTVVKIMEFGAFVQFGNMKEGLIHISKLSDKRVEKVEEVLRIGDRVEATVIKVDNKGRIDLKLNKIILD